MCLVVNILCIREDFCLPISQVWRKASVPEAVLLFCTQGKSLLFKPVPNPCVIPIPELPLCFSNGDKYSQCTAAPSAKKGGGLGQGNKACTAQGFDRTLLELGLKMWSPLLNVARQSNPAAVDPAEVWGTRMLQCECAVWWGFIMWLKLKCRLWLWINLVWAELLSKSKIPGEKFTKPVLKANGTVFPSGRESPSTL